MHPSFRFTSDEDATAGSYPDSVRSTASVRSSSNSNNSESAIQHGDIKYGVQRSVLKELRNEIKTAHDYDALKRITKANRDMLSNIPTTVLNSWLRDSDIVFVRMFGAIVIRKKSKSVKPADYRQILPKMITFLNLLDSRFKFFNEEQKSYLNNQSITEFQRISTILNAVS
jgi:hypothetical protein